MNTHEVPLRERVRAQLLELISEMDLTVNTRLLSEGQLAAKFQVSRSTIRTVLSDLEVEGKVIIDDALKAAIDQYYAQYGAKA